MKKLLITICFLLMALFVSFYKPVSVSAVAPSNEGEMALLSKEITYYDDGSYIQTQVYSSDNNVATMNTYSVNSNVYTKTGVCEVTRYDGNGSITWRYIVTGYYQVNTGISCICYASSYSQYSNSGSWTFSDGASSYSENNAYGQGTFKFKVLFITVQTVTIDVRVSCDVYGNIY